MTEKGAGFLIHRPILSHTQPPVVHKGRQLLSSPRSVLPHRGSGNRPAGVSGDTACPGKGTGKGVRAQQDPRPGRKKAGARGGGGATPHVRQPRSGPAPLRKEAQGAAGATREKTGESPLGHVPRPRRGKRQPTSLPVPRPRCLITAAPRASPTPPTTAASPAAQPGGPRGAPHPGVPANIQTRAAGARRVARVTHPSLLRSPASSES